MKFKYVFKEKKKFGVQAVKKKKGGGGNKNMWICKYVDKRGRTRVKHRHKNKHKHKHKHKHREGEGQKKEGKKNISK